MCYARKIDLGLQRNDNVVLLLLMIALASTSKQLHKVNSSENDESQLSGIDKKQAVTTEVPPYNMTKSFLLALHGAVFQVLEDTPLGLLG